MITRRAVLVSGGVAGPAVLAGCLSGTEDREFAFDRVVVSDKNPGEYDSYRDVPEERTHRIEESLWVLVAVRNAPTDDGTASLDYTFEVETPDGTTWDPVVERNERWEDVDGSDVLSVWENFATYPEDPPGEYEIAIAVEDAFEGERLRTNETFRLEGGD